MKKIGIFLTFTISLLLCTISFGQEQAAAPAYRDGECWQFKAREWDFITRSSAALDGIYEVCYLSGTLKMFQLEGTRRQELEVNAGYRRALLSMLAIAQDPVVESQYYEYLKFPIAVGANWRRSYSFKAPGSRFIASPRVAETRVVTREEVKTQAGSFLAFRVERDETGEGGVRQAYVYYYSPETRSIVKYFFDASVGTGSAKREIELIKAPAPAR